MMNTATITAGQAARAMGLDEKGMMALLSESGVQTEGGLLTGADTEALLSFLEGRQEDSRRKAQENLERLAARYTFLIDTCSLLNEQFPTLMEHLTPLLRVNGKRLFVPSSVLAELRSLLTKKPELRERITAAVKILAERKAEGTAVICGEAEASFADRQLLEVATRFMTSTELLVITQDDGLSNDLLGLNRLQSVQGKRLTVGRINRYGYLSRYLTQEQRFAGSSSRSGWESRSVAALIPEDQTQIPVSHVPASGEAVFGSTALCLGEKLATGGEGSIYDLSDGTVAKIYHRGKLTVGRREKLERMTAEPVCCEGVCWPKELLRDAEGNFVGYRMERARGTELQRALFTRPALEAHFPNWKKADMVQLCITILEKICALHGRGIILGDINPLNILVVSPTEVWFVDCDSYQIGGYPCPVGTVRFTAPEIQKRNFADFLRTEGNEALAVATLLFMLMLPGKSPYAQEGGGDLSEAILAMDFPYPCGDNHSDKTPEGAWRFLWSHLPRYLKEYFYGTFQNGGAYSTEQTRRTTQQWLTAFRYYLRLLQEGKLQDPESAEIFPTRWKVTDPAARTVWERRTCAECGNAFDIMESERDYYREKGMFLPRRCPTCRRLRRKLGSMSFSGSMEL